jgi:bifunctional non-homologous end joining protein LigD
MLPPREALPPDPRAVPTGRPEWLHEIKRDGYRMLAHRNGERVRLISRRGVGWGDRFLLVVAAVEALAARSCTIDGEVIACDGDGLADFELLRYRRRDDHAGRSSSTTIAGRMTSKVRYDGRTVGRILRLRNTGRELCSGPQIGIRTPTHGPEWLHG